MLPIEATSLLGSLSGIGEIAKATFGDDDGGNPTRGSTRSMVPPTGRS